MRESAKKPASKSAAKPATDAATRTAVEENGMGEIQIHENVIASLVFRAVHEIDGVSRLAGGSIVESIADFVGGRRQQGRAIVIDMQPEGRVEIQLKVILVLGTKIPEICPKLQKKIIETVEDATGMTVTRVNVQVQDFEAKQDADAEAAEEEFLDLPNTIG